MAVRKKNTTADIIPIEAYDDECECFMTKTGCFDILQIRCRDIYSASDSVLEYEIYAYTRLYRTYEKPLKLVCLNFPTDTSRQQAYAEHLLSKTDNPVYRDELIENYKKLSAIPLSQYDKEYYFFVYAGTPEELFQNRNMLIQQLGSHGLLHTISASKKEDILFKINNMNTQIY